MQSCVVYVCIHACMFVRNCMALGQWWLWLIIDECITQILPLTLSGALQFSLSGQGPGVVRDTDKYDCLLSCLVLFCPACSVLFCLVLLSLVLYCSVLSCPVNSKERLTSHSSAVLHYHPPFQITLMCVRSSSVGYLSWRRLALAGPSVSPRYIHTCSCHVSASVYACGGSVRERETVAPLLVGWSRGCWLWLGPTRQFDSWESSYHTLLLEVYYFLG